MRKEGRGCAMATTNGTFQWSSVTQVFVKVNKVILDVDHETFEVVLTNRCLCFSSCRDSNKP